MAAELRECREKDGLGLAVAAAQIGWSKGRLSEIETATRSIGPEDLYALARMYKVGKHELRRLEELRATALDPRLEWYSRYAWPSDNLKYLMRAEAQATSIYASQEQYIPGLLQTTAYATELLRNLGNTGPMLNEAVEIRVGRQKDFFRLKRLGLRFHTVIAESLLRKGPREVLGEQLEHLLKMQHDGLIECRVVPESALVYVLGFVLMDFSFGRSIGYADGGLNELDVARMRDVQSLKDMRDRYNFYTGVALSPSESANLIEKYQKGL